MVNGRVSGVGSNAKGLEALIREGSDQTAVTATVEITAEDISVVGPRGGKGVVFMLFYDPTPINVYISRGENKGKNLPHQNIVRKIVPIGIWHGGSQVFFGLPILNDRSVRIAVIIQASQGGPIIGAARN